MWEVLLDSLLDTLKVMPILYLVYLLVSYLGHNNNNKYAKIMNKTKKYGPLIGASAGSIPQCGFSVVMSDLYSKRVITIGTLVAVFLATSDEAIPIMISKPKFILPMLALIGIKFVVGIFFGYMFDLTLKIFRKKQVLNDLHFEDIHNHDCELTSCSSAHIIHDHDEHNDEHKNVCNDKNACNANEKHEKKACVDNIFLDALWHTLEISAFLLIATFIIGLIVYYAGIDNLKYIFTDNKFIQPLIASLVGLIPSCASSVFLVEFYIAGGISFGAMLAGLTAGCGIGILVLFTKNKNFLNNLGIMASIYVIGSIVGILCNLIPLPF